MMEKIAIYTCIIGGYDELQQPAVVEEGFDFICFVGPGEKTSDRVGVWEIRELAHQMLELARPTAPFIFMDAGAPCVRGACPEGKMTCGKPYPKVVRD